MRKIKFRAYEKYGNKVMMLNGIHWNKKNIEMLLCETGGQLSSLYWGVEQYTGLKDKNGKEIYEGDILSFVYRPTRETKENYRGVIEFGNPNGAYNWGWQIRFIGTQPLTAKDILFWIEDIYTDCEVIGNIHENADLLKEKQNEL